MKRLSVYHAAFQAFCSYCLGAHDRYLLPANTSLGVLHYKGRYFAFSSKEAADVFAGDPEKCVNYNLKIAKNSNVLQIHFFGGRWSQEITRVDQPTLHAPLCYNFRGELNLNVLLKCFGIMQADSSLMQAPVTKRDNGTQTDTHFMESNIVKSYEWNEWELRRKAIRLVSQSC